jgi:hypothetical protein
MQRTNFQALMKKYQIRVRGVAGDVTAEDEEPSQDE